MSLSAGAVPKDSSPFLLWLEQYTELRQTAERLNLERQIEIVNSPLPSLTVREIDRRLDTLDTRRAGELWLELGQAWETARAKKALRLRAGEQLEQAVKSGDRDLSDLRDDTVQSLFAIKATQNPPRLSILRNRLGQQLDAAMILSAGPINQRLTAPEDEDLLLRQGSRHPRISRWIDAISYSFWQNAAFKTFVKEVAARVPGAPTVGPKQVQWLFSYYADDLRSSPEKCAGRLTVVAK